jgi:hypothetical protein
VFMLMVSGARKVISGSRLERIVRCWSRWGRDVLFALEVNRG